MQTAVTAYLLLFVFAWQNDLPPLDNIDIATFSFPYGHGWVINEHGLSIRCMSHQPCRPLRGREMLYSFFEMTVTESDLDAKVLKIQ